MTSAADWFTALVAVLTAGLWVVWIAVMMIYAIDCMTGNERE